MIAPKMKIEFTIEAASLGGVVLMVEEMGATDFTFVTLKKKPRKQYTRQEDKPTPVTGKGAEIATAVLKKGSATRAEIAAALKKGGMSPKTMNGLLAKMKNTGMIDQTGRGTYKLSNGAV